MARRTATYTIPADSRDAGKVFILTEMPSDQGEWWAIRALLAIGRNGVDLPDGFTNTGMAGLAEIGVNALFKISPEDAKPLLDELWQACVQIAPDPGKLHVLRAPITEDIDEIKTRAVIRWEVLKLHVDFSQAAALSNSNGSPAAAGSADTPSI